MKSITYLRTVTVAAALAFGALPTMSNAASAFLEITLNVAPADRAAAGAVYEKYKQPFLDTIPGSTSKQLLIRDEDVQVLHGFDTLADAEAYLKSPLFTDDVVRELGRCCKAIPRSGSIRATDRALGHSREGRDCGHSWKRGAPHPLPCPRFIQPYAACQSPSRFSPS